MIMRKLAVFLLLAAACGGGQTTEPATATFSLQVQHASRLDITGDASFTADLGNSDIGTAFALRDQPAGGALRHSVALFRFVTDPLTPGEYPIVPGDEADPPAGFRASLSLERGSADPLACYGDAGMLRVTAADASHVVATVTLEGTCWRESAPAVTSRFTASGTLHAEAGLPGPGEVMPVRIGP